MMNDESRQPKEYDLVLGGNNPPPTNGLVLGGIEGVKQRLASDNVVVRIAALKDALKYDNEGLDIIIKALEDKSNLVKKSAYLYLKQINQPKIQKAIEPYNLYSFFTPLFTVERHCRVNNHSITANKFAISPDNKTLVTYSTSTNRTIKPRSTSETIKLWNLQTGELIKTYTSLKQGWTFGRAIVISPDGHKCYIGYTNDGIEEIDLKTGNVLKILKAKVSFITCLAVSSDGNTLIAGFKEKKDIEVWNLQTGKSHHIGNKSWYVNFVDISIDNKIAVSQSHNAIKVWNLESKELVHILDSHHSLCIGGKISPDGKTVVGINKNIIHKWNLQTGELIDTLELNIRYAEKFVFSQDWKTALGVDIFSGNIKVFNWHTGELINTLKGNIQYRPKSIALSQDEETIVTNNGGTIQVWGVR